MTHQGIKHYDLEFPDCTFPRYSVYFLHLCFTGTNTYAARRVPSKEIVMRFFDICDKEEGGVAGLKLLVYAALSY